MPPARAKTQYIYKSTHERKGIVEIGDRAFGSGKKKRMRRMVREDYYSQGEPRDFSKIKSGPGALRLDRTVLRLGQSCVYSTP